MLIGIAPLFGDRQPSLPSSLEASPDKSLKAEFILSLAKGGGHAHATFI